MCDLILSRSESTDAAIVSLHPRMVRLDLTVANVDGQLSVAHINLTPAQAMTLALQLNTTRTAALQPTPEQTK